MSLHAVYSEYGATGEGITRMLLVTRAYPSADDRIRSIDSETISRERFADKFGDYYAMGAEYEDLVENIPATFIHLIPDFVMKQIEANDAFGFEFYTSIHLNFS